VISLWLTDKGPTFLELRLYIAGQVRQPKWPESPFQKQHAYFQNKNGDSRTSYRRFDALVVTSTYYRVSAESDQPEQH
jgi:hypothetical protein